MAHESRTQPVQLWQDMLDVSGSADVGRGVRSGADKFHQLARDAVLGSRQDGELSDGVNVSIFTPPNNGASPFRQHMIAQIDVKKVPGSADNPDDVIIQTTNPGISIFHGGPNVNMASILELGLTDGAVYGKVRRYHDYLDPESNRRVDAAADLDRVGHRISRAGVSRLDSRMRLLIQDTEI